MENTRKENAVDEELQQIQNIVDEVKCSDEERARYMKVYGVIDYEKRDSYEAGQEEMQEKMTKLTLLLSEAGRLDEMVKAAKDKEYLNILLQEFNL